jgi:hypothetical protein
MIVSHRSGGFGMAEATIDLASRVEAVARYLGSTYPTLSLERYEDATRNVVGFRFSGEGHAAVEFERGWLASLPPNEGEIAQEMHLHHVCAELNETRPGQRVIFGAAGVKRE